MKTRLPRPASTTYWSAVVRQSRHPVLALLAVNVVITLYACPLDRFHIAAVFSILLPAGVLVHLAQTFTTRTAESNHGVYPRATRPIAYWIQVLVLWLAYLCVSLAPILARYFLASPT